MNLGFIPHLHVRVVLLVSLLVSGLVAVVLPVAGSAAAPAEPDLVVLAASAPGDSWDADDGGTGAAVLTYGHVGCTAVDAAGVCTGGVWGKVPGASWIWRSQSADNTEPQATFAKTFEVAVNQTAEPAVLNIAADNVFSVVLNGVEVASGSTFTQGTNFAVPLKAGSNTISISVTNLLNGQGSFWSSLLMDTAVEIGLSAALSGTTGIYAFWDEKAGKPYVGRSVDLMRRLNEHLAAGRITNKSQVKVILDVATDMLPKVEQLAIERCNGGRIVKGGANELANKINAINKSRGDELHRTKATLEGLLGR